MTQEFSMYREHFRYFIEEKSGLFTKEECELVFNIPKMIRSFVGNAKKMKAIVSDEEFEGSTKFTLERQDAHGVDYSMETPKGKITGWLCPVYFHFFPIPPKELFIQIVKV